MRLKNRVAIIEIYSHHVFVHTLAYCLRDAGFIVDIYVTKRIYKDLIPLLENLENINIFLPKENESEFRYLRRIKKDIEFKNEILFINTIQGYRVLYFYLTKFNLKTIAAAGRISEFFGSKYKLSGFKDLRSLLHHNFTKYCISKIIKRLEGIIVHTDQAKSLAKMHGYKNKIHKMPFSLNLGIDRKTKNNLVHFIVTGSINDTSRDYFGLLDAFEKVWRKGIIKNKLTILSGASGKGAYGKKIRNEMIKLKENGYPITFYDDYIPEKKYIESSQKADFLIAPIVFDYYGKGELTSVTVESIRMSTPAIYPAFYKPDKIFEKSSIYFDSYKHLTEILENLSSHQELVTKYKNLAKKSYKNLNVQNESKSIKLFLEEFNE